MARPTSATRALFILAGIGLIAGDADAREYWVSPRGDDHADGSKATPWRTLQQAAERVLAGDTVRVMAGTYRGFNIPRGGTSSARVSFRAEPGAIIDKPLSYGGDTYGINASGRSDEHASELQSLMHL